MRKTSKRELNTKLLPMPSIMDAISLAARKGHQSRLLLDTGSNPFWVELEFHPRPNRNTWSMWPLSRPGSKKKQSTKSRKGTSRSG